MAPDLDSGGRCVVLAGRHTVPRVRILPPPLIVYSSMSRLDEGACARSGDGLH